MERSQPWSLPELLVISGSEDSGSKRIILYNTQRHLGTGWEGEQDEKDNPPPLKSWLHISDERDSYPTKTNLKLLPHFHLPG